MQIFYLTMFVICSIQWAINVPCLPLIDIVKMRPGSGPEIRSTTGHAQGCIVRFSRAQCLRLAGMDASRRPSLAQNPGQAGERTSPLGMAVPRTFTPSGEARKVWRYQACADSSGMLECDASFARRSRSSSFMPSTVREAVVSQRPGTNTMYECGKSSAEETSRKAERKCHMLQITLTGSRGMRGKELGKYSHLKSPLGPAILGSIAALRREVLPIIVALDEGIGIISQDWGS